MKIWNWVLVVILFIPALLIMALGVVVYFTKEAFMIGYKRFD